MDPNFHEFLAGELRQIRDQGLWKEEWPILGHQGPEIRVEGRDEPVLNFCANNYLGLSGHPELLAAAQRTLDEWGYGMSSVRFICGTQALHRELEKRVAAFLGMEDAILYAACFDANGGVFEPLLGAEDAILTDRLNHASIIDGVRLCKAKRLVYEHADMGDLDAKLEEARGRAVPHDRHRRRLLHGRRRRPAGRDLRPGRPPPRARAGGRLPRHRLHGRGPAAARPSTAGWAAASTSSPRPSARRWAARLGGCIAGAPGGDRPAAPAQPALPLLEHPRPGGGGRHAARARAALARPPSCATASSATRGSSASG